MKSTAPVCPSFYFVVENARKICRINAQDDAIARKRPMAIMVTVL
jgi:hypothetical protein